MGIPDKDIPAIAKSLTLKSKELAQEREALLSNLTHDIKNNLMSIKGYVHILSKQMDAEDKSKEYMAKVQERVNSISELMDHLNSLIRITAKDK